MAKKKKPPTVIGPVMKWYGITFLYFLPLQNFELAPYQLPNIRATSGDEAFEMGKQAITDEWYDVGQDAYFIPGTDTEVLAWHLLAFEIPEPVAQFLEDNYQAALMRVKPKSQRSPQTQDATVHQLFPEQKKSEDKVELPPQDEPQKPKE